MSAKGLWVLGLASTALTGCGDEQEFLTVGGCEIRPETRCPGVNLSDQQLEGANLARGVLRDARFDRSTLDGANFSGADLTGASFQDARLNNANFIDARVQGANFEGADLFGVRGLMFGDDCQSRADCLNGQDCVAGECVDEGEEPGGECLEIGEACRMGGLPCCGALVCERVDPMFSLCVEPGMCFTDEDCPPDRACMSGSCELL